MNAINRERREELKARIEPIRQQVEEWRQHKAANERMPERLWEAATELAKGYGVSPVQGILRIDYRGLERRAFGAEKPTAKARAAQRPRFIELPSLATRRAEHVVELEDAAGRKLSLKIPAGHLAEVLPLAQAFWRPSV